MGCSRTTPHTSTRKGIAVDVRPGETFRQCLQKRNNVILLLIRQAKISAGHVDIVLYFRDRPAVNFFGRSWRAMSRTDRIRILVARILEMHELLQTLNGAVIKEPLLEVRPGCLGWRRVWL